MLKIESITENEDGSADVSLNMDYDTLVAFAKIGLLKAITDAVEEVEISTEEIPKEVWSNQDKKKPIPCGTANPYSMCPGCDCWKSTREFSS